MSDVRTLPLRGHDLETRPAIRAHVFRTSPHHWYWAYTGQEPWDSDTLRHGPFDTQPQAYASAWRMVELL